MLEQTKWGEFRLKDLFEVSTTKWFDEGKFVLSHKNWKKLFEFVWRTEDNNGIKWYIEKINNTDPNPSNVISVSQIWTIIAQFRKNERYASQNIFMLKPKEEYENIIGLYCISAINTSLKGNFWWGYSNYPTLKTLKELNIQLPIKNWNPDFEFMNKFIAELEATHQAELEAYLRTTWLEDCELSSSELELLKEFEEWKIQWWKFQIWWENGLFNINSSKKKFDANKVNIWEYWYNYVVRTSLNNWIRGLIDEGTNFLNNGNTISFWQDTATMFYQENPYFTWDKIKIVNSKEDSFNKLNAQFFITTMTKVFSSFSWWSSSFNVKIIESQNIIVPIKNWKPDYELMEKFILAIQKLVIKDIVVYNQEKLKASEELLAW